MQEQECPQVLFDRFEIGERIGHGASSAVYHAYDLYLGRQPVALKIFNSQSLQSETIARIAREIQIAHRVQHDNVAGFYGCWRDEGLILIAMELVQGQSLEDLLQQMGPLPLDAALLCLMQIAAGLEAVHSVGAVHRDLKPANILITAEGVAKIVDFGVSHLGLGPGQTSFWSEMAEPTGDTARLKDRSQVVGTPYYLSPEYLVHGQFDRRADIYALGLTAFELLTGQEAYPSENVMNLVRLKVEQDPPSLLEFWPACPPELDRVIMRAMARNPWERYQSVAELVEDLRPLRSEISRCLSSGAWLFADRNEELDTLRSRGKKRMGLGGTLWKILRCW